MTEKLLVYGMIFPARAGLNLWQEQQLSVNLNIPRTGGVEPEAVGNIKNDLEYSPHGRG